MTENRLSLEQMHAGSDVLSEVARWYSTPEARRWMGEMFQFDQFAGKLGTSEVKGRGKDRLATLAWVAFDAANCPVAFVGGDLTVQHAGSTELVSGSLVTRETTSPPTLGFMYAVQAGQRHRGYGRRTLRAVLEDPSTHDIEAFECTVDGANAASLGLIRLSRSSQNRRDQGTSTGSTTQDEGCAFPSRLSELSATDHTSISPRNCTENAGEPLSSMRLSVGRHRHPSSDAADESRPRSWWPPRTVSP